MPVYEILANLIDRGLNILPLHGIDPVNKHVDPKTGLMVSDCLCPMGASCDKSPGKHPNHPNGVYGATRDKAILREWVKKYPNGNWGARGGAPVADGKFVVVVDVDPRNGGDVSLRDIVAEHGPMPDTWTQDTGGKGNHYIYYSDTVIASSDGIPGIDIIGDKKYFVVAPSMHESGRHYTWAAGHHPIDVKIAAAPKWVLAATSSGGGADRPKRDGERTARDTILGEAFALAGKLGVELGNGNFGVECPWAKEHSDARGRGQDSSTVILPPAGDSSFGGFKCHHSHCSKRKWQDVMQALPEAATTAAKRKYPAKLAAVPKDQPQELREDEEEKSEQQRLIDECRERLSYKETKTGSTIRPDVVNTVTILTYDPRWRGILVNDEFAHRIIFTRRPDWHDDDKPKRDFDVMTDSALNCMDAWFRRFWGIELDMTTIIQAVDIVSKRDGCNPLQAWLDGLTWDGESRLEKWLHNYLGCEDTEYHRIAGRKWVLSAIARAYQPGCKADHVLILEGEQGRGKSSALAVLAGAAWFTDSPIDIGNKDAYLTLQGKWIIELGELSSLKKADIDRVKAFFTSQTDNFRPPFGKLNAEHPRQCIFAGTVNPEEYLTDATGNRRFWPAKCGFIDLETLAADREQIWAEAVSIYKAWVSRGSSTHEALWWPAMAEHKLFGAEAASRVVPDSSWEMAVSKWLKEGKAASLLKTDNTIDSIEILTDCLGIEIAQQTKREQDRLSRIMDLLGWIKVRPRIGGGRGIAYKPNNALAAS